MFAQGLLVPIVHYNSVVVYASASASTTEFRQLFEYFFFSFASLQLQIILQFATTSTFPTPTNVMCLDIKVSEMFL